MSPFDLQPPQGYLLIINANSDDVEYFFSMSFEEIQRYLQSFVRVEIADKNPFLFVSQEMIDNHFKKTKQTYTIEEPVML